MKYCYKCRHYYEYGIWNDSTKGYCRKNHEPQQNYWIPIDCKDYSAVPILHIRITTELTSYPERLHKRRVSPHKRKKVFRRKKI